MLVAYAIRGQLCRCARVAGRACPAGTGSAPGAPRRCARSSSSSSIRIRPSRARAAARFGSRGTWAGTPRSATCASSIWDDESTAESVIPLEDAEAERLARFLLEPARRGAHGPCGAGSAAFCARQRAGAARRRPGRRRACGRAPRRAAVRAPAAVAYELAYSLRYRCTRSGRYFESHGMKTSRTPGRRCRKIGVIEMAPAARTASTTASRRSSSSEMPGRIGVTRTLHGMLVSFRRRTASMRWRGGGVPGSLAATRRRRPCRSRSCSGRACAEPRPRARRGRG